MSKIYGLTNTLLVENQFFKEKIERLEKENAAMRRIVDAAIAWVDCDPTNVKYSVHPAVEKLTAAIGAYREGGD